MESIKIIKDKSELEGTCYIDLSLGKYQGQHWEEASLFFDEEVFGYIEMVFEKHIPGYDHYGMNDADSKAWDKVIADLKELSWLLETASDFKDVFEKIGFFWRLTRLFS